MKKAFTKEAVAILNVIPHVAAADLASISLQGAKKTAFFAEGSAELARYHIRPRRKFFLKANETLVGTVIKQLRQIFIFHPSEK
jgi:hypothetical protein